MGIKNFGKKFKDILPNYLIPVNKTYYDNIFMELNYILHYNISENDLNNDMKLLQKDILEMTKKYKSKTISLCNFVLLIKSFRWSSTNFENTYNEEK